MTGPISLDAVTPVKLFANPNPSRIGYAVNVPTGVTLLVREVPLGSTALTSTDFGGNRALSITGPFAFESGARGDSDVYGLLSTGTASLYVEEFNY